MKRPRQLMIVISMVFCLGFGLAISAPAAAAPVKLLILPFHMNAPQDTTYLQQGILDMLTSRLEWPDRVMVVSTAETRQSSGKLKGKTDENAAKELGRSLGVDYLLFGSVTMIGSNVSLDAGLLDIKGTNQPLKVHSQTQGLDGVIPKVNEFAEEINAKVFGRGTAPATAAKPEPKPAATESLPSYRRHPDYLLAGKESQQVSSLNPNFIAAVGTEDREGSFWRSLTLNIEIVGLDVGDVDGDGKNEVIYASTQNVYVTRFENGQLVPVATYKGSTGDKFLSVDVLDIKGSGRAWIFISGQRGLAANSLVLELQGDKLVPVIKDSPWYFRVVTLPQGPRLVGQRGGIGTLFYGGVHILQLSGSDFTTVQPIKLPKEANIFNFALANLSKAGGEQILTINKFDHLVVMSPSGEEMWSSKDEFCGRAQYMQDAVPSTGNAVDGPQRIFIPSRILLTDLKDEGIPQVIVAQNERGSLTRWLERAREYKRGAIQSLSYSQMAMKENWRSRQLPGPLVDYQVKDFNNDGKPDLIIAAVLKGGEGALAQGRSVIVAYELASPAEMREAESKRQK